MIRIIGYLFLLGNIGLSVGCKELGNKKKFVMASKSMEGTLVENEEYYGSSKESYPLGSIIVFKFYNPFLKREFDFVFRVLAKSGDTVAIKEGIFYRNNKVLSLPALAKHAYVIDNRTFDIKQFDSSPTAISDSTSIIRLSNEQKIEVAKKVKLIRYILPPDSNDQTVLRTKKELISNNDNFGPLVIPKIGDEVVYEESPQFIFWNLVSATEAKKRIDEELFFVIGDNLSDSFDSRNIGLIKKSQIKASIDF